jgi:hypothetical protein
MTLGGQILALFVLALPIACIAWTVTHEEVLREAREYCANKSEACQSLLKRKFFYLFTCEYCFSHYVTIAFLFLTRYKLLYTDWRGYLVGGFALVWVANFYMSLFGRLRLDIKREHVEIKQQQNQVEKMEQNTESSDTIRNNASLEQPREGGKPQRQFPARAAS